MAVSKRLDQNGRRLGNDDALRRHHSVDRNETGGCDQRDNHAGDQPGDETRRTRNWGIDDCCRGPLKLKDYREASDRPRTDGEPWPPRQPSRERLSSTRRAIGSRYAAAGQASALQRPRWRILIWRGRRSRILLRRLLARETGSETSGASNSASTSTIAASRLLLSRSNSSSDTGEVARAKLRLEDLPCALINGLTRLALGVRAVAPRPFAAESDSLSSEELLSRTTRSSCSRPSLWSRRGAASLTLHLGPGRVTAQRAWSWRSS